MYNSSIAKSFKLVPLWLNNTIWAGPFWATVWGPVQVKIAGIAVMYFSVEIILDIRDNISCCPALCLLTSGVVMCTCVCLICFIYIYYEMIFFMYDFLF